MGSLNTGSELVDAGSCWEDRLLRPLELPVGRCEVMLTLPEVSEDVEMELGVSLGYVKYTGHPDLVGDTLDTEVDVADREEDGDSVTFPGVEGVLDGNNVDADEIS